MRKLIFIGLILGTIVSDTISQQLAFPEAEGFGAYSMGGRGGRVIYVTNLHDQGIGSLRHAVDQEGPRTIVFAVSGIIDLKKRLTIVNPYITIAGQTAPGDGICIRGETLLIEGSHVIIRHIRVRLGDGMPDDWEKKHNLNPGDASDLNKLARMDIPCWRNI